MTLSEKNTILDWANREVQRRTNAYRRASPTDEHALCRTAGALHEAEKVLLELTRLLHKL